MTDQPSPKAAPAAFELPDTTDLAAVNAAEVAVIRLAAEGRIGSRAALRFSRMLEYRRRAIADHELEARIEQLEREQTQQRARDR